VEYSADEFVKAAYNGDKVVVELFVAAGMDLDQTTEQPYDRYDEPIKDTALSAAIAGGNIDLANELLDAGADPNVVDVHATPLTIASIAGEVGLVEKLLDSDADVDLKGRGGFTPLIASSLQGHKDVVERLISAGADFDIRANEPALRAIDFAEREDHTGIVELLVDAGSVPLERPSQVEDFDPNEPVAKVTIRAVDNEMLYEQDRFTVPAGEEISVTLDNTGTTSSAMLHNIVILRSDSDAVLDRVGQAGLMAGADRGYIPTDESILAHSEIAEPGEFVDFTFTAPNEPGEYRFICTYPGHYGIMQGVMNVVE